MAKSSVKKAVSAAKAGKQAAKTPAPSTEPKPHKSLAPALAKTMLRENLENLRGKIEAGRPLTGPELALVQSAAMGDEVTQGTGYALNQVELAAALKVNRKTVQRWLDIDGTPGARSDGRYSVIEWRDWAAKNGHAFKEDATPDKRQLEAEKLVRQNKLLDIQIQEREGLLVPLSSLEVWAAQAVTAAKVTLLPLASSLAPQLAGQTIPEIERRLREAFDEVCGHLSAKPWRK